jgi:hypothetical protein
MLSRQATSRHTTVLGGMWWCVMVAPNGSVIPGGTLPISSSQVHACSGLEFRKSYRYLVGRLCL